MVSANDADLDQQAFVYAIGLAGVIQDSLPQPNGRALLIGQHRPPGERQEHVVDPPRTTSTRASENRGVGGTTLASAATTFKHHEQQVTYTQQTILRPTLLNQFQVLVGHEREPTASRSPARGIVVAGAFTGGGAQADLLRTETHMNLTESLAWTKGLIWSRPAFNFPTGAGAASTIGPTSAARSTSRASTPTRPDGRTRSTQQQGNGDLVVPRKAGRRLRQGRLAGAARAVAGIRPALRLAELLSRQQQRRAAGLGGLRARQQRRRT